MLRGQNNIVEPGYESLAKVLQAALNQAQSGKGKERHAADEPFHEQEICQNTRAVGYGYPLGQARKKAREALRLLETKGPDAAIAECLGAINYLAAAVIVMQEQDDGKAGDEQHEGGDAGCVAGMTVDEAIDEFFAKEFPMLHVRCKGYGGCRR
jgi:hypothetical protein